MHVPALTTTRIHLLLALAVALTGTVHGLGVAGVVLAVTGLRTVVRHRLDRAPDASSRPVRARVLPAPQHRQLLDPARAAGHHLAG